MKENPGYKILTVIPARGGSKGIPRKNLRHLNKRPLIYYSIKNALNCKFFMDVYVSSEDEEILMIAKKFGAKVFKRNPENALDHRTLDPVIYEAYETIEQLENKKYDLIITLQPTSPLLDVISLNNAIEEIIKNKETETILSVKEDSHLSWSIENGKPIPNFTKRLNRQQLKSTFKETGAFLITRKEVISRNNRIGSSVSLYALNSRESIDIDSFEDWNLCEYYMRLKTIVIVVSGNRQIGLGHVYNTLSIANGILNHKVIFLVDEKSDLAFKKIAENNYEVYQQESKSIIEDILKLKPDIVINDILDTSSDYISSLKSNQVTVINIEDLGEGAQIADMVLNAMYPEKEIFPNHFFGEKYFILRDEFLFTPPKKIKKNVNVILISFGGVDPNNYTDKILKIVYPYCIENHIQINVILGLGYREVHTLERYKGIHIKQNISNISDFIVEADIVFTSAGRTTFEVAAIGTPSIVLAQNKREQTHFFATEAHGFLNLGLGTEIPEEFISKAFLGLVESFDKRRHMSELLLDNDLKNGKERVMKLISKIINQD